MTDSNPTVSPMQLHDWFANLPTQDFANQRILLVVPNVPASGALPLIFDALFQNIRPLCMALDVLVALGNDPPMSDHQIATLLGISERERGRLFFQTQFFNHDPNCADRLVKVGTLTSIMSAELTNGLIARDVPIQINSRTSDYDLLLVLSSVFPERSVGYSGGNACFFPGLGGPDILDVIEQIDAAVCDDETVGVKMTLVRRVADAASAMIPQIRRAITFVTESGGSICGLFYDTPESAWNAAADLLSTFAHRSKK